MRYAVLLVVGGIVVFPIYMTVVNSLLSSTSIIAWPPELFPFDPQWDNFKKALDEVPLVRYMLNSLIMSGIIVVGQLVTAALAAYAFAFLRFPGRTLLFVLFLSTLMVPWEVSIVPNFQTIQWLGWLDSYQALTVPFLATGLGTFLLRQHFLTIPRELRDAAAIDGYGHIRFLVFVVLPLSRPVLAALAVFGFLQAWNQYLWPLLVTNEDNMRTVQIGLAALRGREVDTFNITMAATVISALPMLIMLVLFQRQLVRGLTAGALKG
ncbi:MAG: glycerol-3-phosphate ABC transporter permease [Dehalococcoidia bacterium SM23_28_1]|nr:MAG: glycerol-3-phosphate ABC transporter permease [Dehalococcoidia bacterium SM23_28_1]